MPFRFPGQIHIPWLTIKAPRFGKRKRCHQLSQPWRPVICKRWKEFYRKRLCLECGSTALRELRGLQSSVKIVSTPWYHRLSYVVFFFPVKVCCRISLGSPMKSPLSLVCLLEKADLTVSEKHPKPKQWSFEIYIDIIRSFRFKALSLVILVSRNCWFCVAKLIFSWKVECSWPLLLRISRLLLSSFLTFFSIRQNL